MKKADSHYWIIPPGVYNRLDDEFHFDFDPCPYPFKQDGINIEWGNSNWVNPPFRAKDAINGHGAAAFIRKAIEQHKRGKTSVLILPVYEYIDTLLEAGAELRSMGRVKWLETRTGVPHKHPPHSALFILR